MKKLILTAIVIFAFNTAKGQEIATTESGKKVMLFDDGTYKVINSKQNTTNVSSNNSSSENKSFESVQCSGTTKKGTRCKRMVKSANGRCYQH
jgi:endonuclease G